MLSIQMIQTLYIFGGLVITLLLSQIWEKKKACPCRVRVPISMITMLSTIAIGFMNGFNPLTYIIIGLAFFAGLGSFLAPRIENAGGVAFIVAYLGAFALFDFFNIINLFNIGLENLSIFGALLAIVLMFLKKQNSVTTIYVIGLGMFFMTGVTSMILPIVVGTILWVLSELIILFVLDYNKDLPKIMRDKLEYFAAGLFSYGVLMLPLALL